MKPLPATLFSPPQPLPATLFFRLVVAADERPLSYFLPSEMTLDFAHWFQQVWAWQQTGRAYWVVGLMGETFIASGQLFCHTYVTELANLYVTPAWRGQGVGSAMIAVLEAVGRHLQRPRIDIGVKADNVRAQALYQRLGYEPLRQITLPGGETAVFLRKHLS